VKKIILVVSELLILLLAACGHADDPTLDIRTVSAEQSGQSSAEGQWQDVLTALDQSLDSDLVIQYALGDLYVIEIENPTGYDLSDSTAMIRYYDSNGTLLEHCGFSVMDWGAGSKTYARVHTETDFDYAELGIRLPYQMDFAETSFHPVSVGSPITTRQYDEIFPVE